MRGRLFAVGIALLMIASTQAAGAGAAEPEWHSEAAIGALGIPSPVGRVGDIAFWAPNRGVLITGGVEGVSPAGVYAYDGTGWHLYSTVCGGSEGRIAWVGPDEFWTVSDYANKQEGNLLPQAEYARTLCRFANGEVVASYAQPLGVATTYQQMRAAACEGPANCWFAGDPLEESARNTGSFHLHWDGTGLSAVPSQIEPESEITDPPGAVTGLDFFAGQLFESAEAEPFLRSVNLGLPGVFSAVPSPEGATGPYLLAADPGQVWAVGRNSESVLRMTLGEGFDQVPVATEADETLETAVAAASEPNGAGVWVAGTVPGVGNNNFARIARIGAGGGVSATVRLPTPAEGIDPKGGATSIACPAPGQCWLATEEGWLFHLGDPLPQDTDPAMHKMITFRPEDASSRVFVPAGLPVDDSGETEPSKGLGEGTLEPFPQRRPSRSVVFDVHQKVLGKRILELSFKLRGRAHVQLIAKVHHKAVAKTARLTLGKGPHKLRLKLDPKHWPTGLDFQVHPIGKKK